jgi:hypothetical protein
MDPPLSGELISSQRGGQTMKIATSGLDIAKQVFQVHGADRMGRRVLRRLIEERGWPENDVQITEGTRQACSSITVAILQISRGKRPCRQENGRAMFRFNAGAGRFGLFF